MPLSAEDDFGFGKPQHAKTRKAAGICLPRHFIGRTVLDVPAEKEAGPRFNGIRDLVRLATSRRQAASAAENEAGDENKDKPTPSSSSRHCKAAAKYSVRGSSTPDFDDLIVLDDGDNTGRLDEVAVPEEAQVTRRLKRPVLGPDGKVINAQAPSNGNYRPQGLRAIHMVPEPQKHPQAGFKRQFAWIHRPTAWDNPVTYEDPPEPGKRPSHPVCANGPVAVDGKRMFPERAPTATREERPPSIAAETKYRDTSWMTRWHCSASDVDPPKLKRCSLNMPIAACTTTRDDSVFCIPAGRPSCGLYDNMRLADEARAMTPLTAR